MLANCSYKVTTDLTDASAQFMLAEHVQKIYSASVDSTVAGRLAALGTIDLEAAALRIGAAA